MFPSSYFGKKRLKMIHNPKQNKIFQLSFADITSHRIYCFVCHALSHADHTCHYASDYTFDQTQIILLINQIYDFMMTIVWHFVPESLFCLSHTDPESDKRHRQSYCNFQYSTCQNRSADSQLSCDRELLSHGSAHYVDAVTVPLGVTARILNQDPGSKKGVEWTV